MAIKHKLIVWVGIAAVVARGMRPPRYSYDAGSFGSSRVDVAQLLVEWAMIVLIASGLYFVWPAKQR